MEELSWQYARHCCVECGNSLLNVIRLQSAGQQIIRIWEGQAGGEARRAMILHSSTFSFNCCVKHLRISYQSSFTAKLNDEANMRYMSNQLFGSSRFGSVRA